MNEPASTGQRRAHPLRWLLLALIVLVAYWPGLLHTVLTNLGQLLAFTLGGLFITAVMLSAGKSTPRR